MVNMNKRKLRKKIANQVADKIAKLIPREIHYIYRYQYCQKLIIDEKKFKNPLIEDNEKILDFYELEQVVSYNRTDVGDDAALSIHGSAETGGLVGVFDSGDIAACSASSYVKSDNASAGGLIGKVDGETYLSIMAKNLDVLREALK